MRTPSYTSYRVWSTRPGSSEHFLARLQDPHQWKMAAMEVAFWFLAAWLLLPVIAGLIPGYPILVGTESMPTGLYWLDRTDRAFTPGKLITFLYQAPKGWLEGRYLPRSGLPLHTKIVLGTAGDTVIAAPDGTLTVCRAAAWITPTCIEAGFPRSEDSLGRPMHPWLEANHQYTLQPDELWVYAPAEKSLDSRYHGPIRAAQVRGVATPLLTRSAK